MQLRSGPAGLQATENPCPWDIIVYVRQSTTGQKKKKSSSPISVARELHQLQPATCLILAQLYEAQQN